MFRDNVLKNRKSEMSLEEKYIFFLKLRKNLNHHLIQSLLTGQEVVEKLLDENPNLIFIVTHYEFQNSNKKDELLIDILRLKEDDNLRTVARLSVFEEESDLSQEDAFSLPNDSFEELKNLSHHSFIYTEDNNFPYPSIKKSNNNQNLTLNEAIEKTSIEMGFMEDID